MRTNKPIYRQTLHKGSANSLKIVPEKNIMITCSADSTIVVTSMPEFKTILKINAKDMVFAVEEVFDVIIAGSAKGNLLAFDLNSGDALYGYGVMKKGGCRLLGLNA
jgi:hypothetical protein